MIVAESLDQFLADFAQLPVGVLGPTNHDALVKGAVAKVFGIEFDRSPVSEWIRRIQSSVVAVPEHEVKSSFVDHHGPVDRKPRHNN